MLFQFSAVGLDFGYHNWQNFRGETEISGGEFPPRKHA